MATTTRRFTAHSNPGNADAQRKRELGHIHQGRAALRWSEDDYRFHLRNLTGKSSSAALLAFIGRTTGSGYSDVKFVPTLEASKVIEALKAMLDRAKRAQGAGHA